MALIEKGIKEIYIWEGEWSPTSTNLVYYPLDSTYGLNSYDGTHTLSTSTSDMYSQYDKYLTVNTSLSYLYDSSITGSDLGTAFTVYFRVKTTGSNNTAEVSMTGDDFYGWNVGLCEGGFPRAETCSSSCNSIGGSTYSTDTRYCIVYTYSEGSYELYVNNSLVGINSQTITWSGTTYLRINYQWSGTTSTSIGSYAKVGIDKSVRTSTKVSKFYNDTKADLGL